MPRQPKGSAPAASAFRQLASFHEKPMPVRHFRALDKSMAVFGAKCGYVDAGQRISRLEPDPGAGLHGAQALDSLKHRQRAAQAPEVVDRDGCGFFSCQRDFRDACERR